MVKFEAFIMPFELEEVCEELSEMRVRRITATEGKGDIDETRDPNGSINCVYTPNFKPKTKIEVVVSESQAKRVISTIFRAARTSDPEHVKATVAIVERVI